MSTSDKTVSGIIFIPYFSSVYQLILTYHFYGVKCNKCQLLPTLYPQIFIYILMIINKRQGLS